MPITLHGEGGSTTINGPESMKYYRMIMLQSALKFEITTGMKMTRGMTAYSRIKKEYGLKGNKDKVLEAFTKLVDAQNEKVIRVVEVA